MADFSLPTSQGASSHYGSIPEGPASDPWRDPLGLGTTLYEALEIRRDSTSYHLNAFISADAQYKNGIAKHDSAECNLLSQSKNQLDSRTALRIATSDLLKQDIVMLISILRDISAAADKRLIRGSALLCTVTFLWGICRNARSSKSSSPMGSRNRTLNTIKDPLVITSAVPQANPKNLGTHESHDTARRQSVLSAASMLPLERWLLTGMAVASLYALFGISTRLIAGHCLKRAEDIQRKLLKDRLNEDYRQDLVGWTWTWLYRVGGFW